MNVFDCMTVFDYVAVFDHVNVFLLYKGARQCERVWLCGGV